MSIRESFEWVTLPAGIGDDRSGETVCRVSVFVAPQVTLVDEPNRRLTLGELEDLLDWPQTIVGIEFSLEVEGDDPVPATKVGPPPTSDLWRRIFPDTTAIDPFVPDDPTIQSVVQFDMDRVLDVVEGGYADAATLEPLVDDHFDPQYWEPELWMPPQVEPGTLDGDPNGNIGDGDGEVLVAPESRWSIGSLFPSILEVVSEPGNSWLHGVAEGASNLLAHANFVAGEPRLVEVGDGMPLSNDAAVEVARFADSMRLNWVPLGGETDLPDRTAALAESYDLHRILAAIGDHPALLRALGLVIDLEVTTEAPSGGRVRVIVHRNAGRTGGTIHHDRTPWVTVASLSSNGFAPAPSEGDSAPPGLEPLDRYRLVQLDVEGAGIQLLQRATEELTGATGSNEAGLPPLRTAGLRLIEAQAAERMMRRGAHSNSLRDVVANNDIGQPLEISLDADDVQRGIRLDVHDESTGHWHSLHARVARYMGGNGPTLLDGIVDEGSISGSFTGRPLAPGESLTPGDVISVEESLVTWHGWSLAAARPGRVISADPLDADAVHRADNETEIVTRPSNDPLTTAGLSIDTAALPGSLPQLRFGHSYRVRMRTVDLAGNSLTMAQADAAIDETSVTEPVVFRRFEPVMPPVVAFSPGPKEPPIRIAESERRVVVRSGLDDGDDAFGPQPGVDERLLFAPECSVTLAEWHGAFDEAMGTAAPAGARDEAYRRAARESGTLESQTAEIPWLADPGSAGACFSDLPGMAADSVLTIPWPFSSQGPGPIRLLTIALDVDEVRPPEFDEGEATVTVFLPPGARSTALVSSVPADGNLMALPALWRARLDAESLQGIEAKLAIHRHQMITPTVPIEFVHATQRPRSQPRAVRPAELAPRQPDQTHVRATVPWSVHAPSTGALELEAGWTVPRDEPIEVGSAEAAAAADDRDQAPGIWVAAADVIRTMIGQSAIVAPVPVEGPFLTEVTVSGIGDDPGASLELDTTAHVRLRLRAIATSRFAEFFPPEYGPAPATGSAPARESRLNSISEELVVDVPSTRRPQPPTVLEVMPLVVRQREPQRVFREGGWLRVWLARPWFSTGWDESPAVIASPDGQPLEPDGSGAYSVCTLVGPDPARQIPAFTGITPHALGGFPEGWIEVRLAEMKEADSAGTGRTIALSDRTIDWDPARRLVRRCEGRCPTTLFPVRSSGDRSRSTAFHKWPASGR